MSVASKQGPTAGLEETAGERRIFANLARAWRPRKLPPADVWVEQNIQLPPDLTADPGPFDLTRYPFWREPLRRLGDTQTQKLIVMGPNQVGKTLFLIAGLWYLAEAFGTPALVAAPDQDYALEIRDRVYAIGEASPRLQDKVPPRYRWNDRHLDLGAARAFLGWAGNPQRLSGKPCQFVFGTECDRWRQHPSEGQTQALLRGRTKAFLPRALQLFEGSPNDETSFLDAEFQASDRRRWCCACPHCGHRQELRYFAHKDGPFAGRGGLGGLTDREGNYLTPDAARRTAYYRCERGCRIDEIDKERFVASGVWCPEGQTVDREGRLQGQPALPPRVVGYQFCDLAGPTVSWGSAGAAYIEARRERRTLAAWWNASLGLKFSHRVTLPDWKKLGSKLAGGHRRGTVPKDAVLLTAGADKQGRNVHWIVRAWGEGGTSWAVDWGIATPQIGGGGEQLAGSDLAQLETQIVRRSFPVAGRNPLGLESLVVRHLAIDCRFETNEVAKWVAGQPGDRVLAVMGSGSTTAARWGVAAPDLDPKSGKRLPAGRFTYTINVAAYKTDLQARWDMELGQPGVWHFYKDVLLDGETYLRQITNEGRSLERDKRGRMRVVWTVGGDPLGNHFFDCEVYAFFAADLAVGGVWEELVARLAAATGRRVTTVESESGGAFAAR